MATALRSAAVHSAFLLASALCAQQHAFVQYTTRDGLAQSQVRAMAQDARGYLWFGTLGGASRFDGAQFVNYALQEGLPDAQVHAMIRDGRGTLWLAAGHALLSHDGVRFNTFPLPAALHDARVSALASGIGNELFIATDEGSVFRKGGSAVEPLPGYPADTTDGVRVLLSAPDGALLIGSRNGLLRWKDGRCRAVALGDQSPKSISALALASGGTLWVGTFGDGLFSIAPDGSTSHYTEENGLLQNNVRDLLLDDRERLWVGTKFGLNVIAGGGNGEPETRILAFTVHQGLPNDNIWCMMKDDEGHLWFGTDGAGVLRYTGERFVTYTTADGLCSDLVMAVVADSSGDIWLGTYGNGICRKDGMAMITTVDGLPNNTIWCGVRDRLGRLWFGTSDGLCRIDNGLVAELDSSVALTGQRVLSLWEDPTGALWCGTRDGLYAIGGDGAVVRHPAGDKGPGRSVRAIDPDRRGRLWLATDEGLSMYDGSGFTRFDVEDGLSDNSVFCLLHDHRGRLWAGTANGIACLDEGRFITFRPGQDFGSNYIDLLLMDPDGRIWAGTNNGLFVFHPDSLLADPSRIDHFNLADGLRSLEFNLNARHRDRRGRLMFGSTAGLVLHDPAQGTGAVSEPPPRLYITGIRSFLRTTDWTGLCDSIHGASGLPIGLRLKPGRNHLTFDLSAIAIAHPERVRYRYRIAGTDPDWLPPTTDRSASYSNLAHGEHVFEVVASSDGRTWSAPATFQFSIEPPFWSRWWFFALCGAALTLLAWSVQRYRSLRRARKEETRQLMLRSRMLQLEQQALNAHMNRHFVFNALNSIQFYINRQDRVAANKYLTSFARLIRKNLDASQSDTTTLAEELERLELYLVLEHMRFKDKFRYTLEIAPSVQASRVQIPAMMLQPYVENSIWHGILPTGRPGGVHISAVPTSNDRIHVVIQDDGIGIDHSRQAKNGEEGDHISRGIEITKGRADVLRRLHLADIHILGPEQLHAVDGTVNGTRVIIDLPAGQGVGNGASRLRKAPEPITFEPR